MSPINEERRKECVQGAVNRTDIANLKKSHDEHKADSDRVRAELFSAIDEVKKKLDRPSWFALWIITGLSTLCMMFAQQWLNMKEKYDDQQRAVHYSYDGATQSQAQEPPTRGANRG